MTEFALSLNIKTVGDKEALRALDDLDKKGQKVVENAAGALGKSMGQVAVAYQTGGKQMQQALTAVAEGHADAMRAAQKQEQAVESLAMRQAHAMSTGARGLEMLGRTGELTGRSLDAVLGQASAVAFAFGPAGQVVSAVAIATAAVVEMFMRTSRETKKLADQAIKDFERIAHMDVKGQGEAASLLYSGDPFSAGIARFGIQDLQGQAATFRARIAAGTSTFTGAFGIQTKEMTADAKDAAAALKLVNDELARRNTLLPSITGPGGTIERAGRLQAAEDRPGFVTDAQRDADRAAKADQAFKDKQANEFNKAAIKRFQEARKQQEEEDKQIIEAGLKRANAALAAAAKVQKIVHKFAEEMQKEISSVLAHGIADGFEAAFSGKGIGNAFKTLTATVLSGLGDFMEKLGAQMIVVGLALDVMAKSLLSLNGPAAIAAGVALVAAGAGLKAIAGSFGGGSASGAGSSSSTSAAAPTFLSFGVQASATPTTSQSAPNAKASAVFNIFGPDDPKAQRAIAEAWNKANLRGLVAA